MTPGLAMAIQRVAEDKPREMTPEDFPQCFIGLGACVEQVEEGRKQRGEAADPAA